MARGLAELGGQESLHEIPGHFRADRTSAHAEYIHVIIFDDLLGGEMIVDETGANAFHLVGAHRRADAAAADRDAAIDFAGDDGLAERHDEVGIIVIGNQGVRTEIRHLMARRANATDQFFLQSKTAVIRGNSNAHRVPLVRFSRPRPDRPAPAPVPAAPSRPGWTRRPRVNAATWRPSRRRSPTRESAGND